MTRYPFSRSTLILGIVASIAAVWAVVLLWPGRAPLWLLVVLVCGDRGRRAGLHGRLRPGEDLRPHGSAAPPASSTSGVFASLSTVTLIGVILDVVAPGGPETYTVDSFRVARVGSVPRLGNRGGPDPALSSDGAPRPARKQPRGVCRAAGRARPGADLSRATPVDVHLSSRPAARGAEHSHGGPRVGHADAVPAGLVAAGVLAGAGVRVTVRPVGPAVVEQRTAGLVGTCAASPLMLLCSVYPRVRSSPKVESYAWIRGRIRCRRPSGSGRGWRRQGGPARLRGGRRRCCR